MAFTFNLAPPRVGVPERDWSFMDQIMQRREDRKAGDAAVQSAQGLTPEQIEQVTPLLKNRQTMPEGLRMIREWRKPQEFGFTTAPDGTLLRTDSRAGTAEALGKYAKPEKPERTVATAANERALLAQQYGLDPNSPEGRSFILSGSLPPNRQARVPAAIQNAEAGDLQDLQGLTTINSELGRFADQIDKGELNLGGVENWLARGKNFVGASDESSRNFASFQATLERQRNESLRLNKGVQTEGDAQRAWNELFANINDPKVVRQRLAEIMRLNDVAADFKRNIIGQRREDNNLDPLDLERMIARPAAIGGEQPQQPAPAASEPPRPGTIVDGYIFRGGDPGDPNSWAKMPERP